MNSNKPIDLMAALQASVRTARDLAGDDTPFTLRDTEPDNSDYEGPDETEWDDERQQNAADRHAYGMDY